MTELERYKRALDTAVNHIMDQIGKGHLCAGPKVDAQQILREIDTILHPEPEWEEVTIERWECRKCARVHHEYAKALNCCRPTHSPIKLTGVDRRQVQKVERSMTSKVTWKEGDYCEVYPQGELKGLACWSELIGKTGILTFTWE